MKSKKLRVAALLLGLVMLVSACGSANKPAEESKDSSPEASTESSEASGEQQTGAKKRVALLCDVAGTQVYILDLIAGLNAGAEKYGFEPIVSECADAAAYEDNARALVNEGVDLLIGGNWQAGEAIATVAKEFPDKAQYALIDSEVEQENVKCIFYHEQEGAYLIGQIAALVTAPEDMIFGGVHVSEGAGSFKWRYGFMEGVRSIKPEATFIFNYVNSYSDPAKAKEYAIQQYEQGAKFINAACAGGDSGVFEAAKEKGFYTSGQDVDLTSPDNPYVLTCQLKDADQTVLHVLDQFFTEGKWNTDNEVLGLAEGAIGAVHITHESKNPAVAPLTEEVIKQLKETAEKIRTGELNLKEMPDEQEYLNK
ncbi:MAG: BMP family protein [Ndongobacter sp.]|nr:BMP family protein [Ndongobacter sp.]